MSTLTLHKCCIGCIARVSSDDPALSALAVLTMLACGSVLEDVIHDLCFAHRRRVEDAIKKGTVE